jgi:glycosyltransferase involved in cell wall biosynthesis
VLDAARTAPDLHFKIVGSGQLQPLLQRHPPNVEHVPWVEYERLPQELQRAGCALGVFGTSEKAGRVIPNKVFQALACGVPVITADTPAARELLVEDESAQLVPPGEAPALAAAVRRFAEDPARARQIAEGGLRAYRAHASERALGERWRALIEGLLH